MPILVVLLFCLFPKVTTRLNRKFDNMSKLQVNRPQKKLIFKELNIEILAVSAPLFNLSTPPKRKC